MALAQAGGKTYSNTALTEVKVGAFSGACLVFNFVCFNPDASSTTFVQFFDLASADVTVGTTTPAFVLALGPKDGVVLGLTCPRRFRTAVTIACTATATGAGAPATAGVVSFDYVGG